MLAASATTDQHALSVQVGVRCPWNCDMRCEPCLISWPLQAGPLGGANLDFPVPKWLVAATVLEEEDGSHTANDGEEDSKPELPITDLVALVIGIGGASVDVAIGHGSFTLCNLLACVIATDIMQVCALWSSCNCILPPRLSVRLCLC